MQDGEFDKTGNVFDAQLLHEPAAIGFNSFS
jgi:hypothetical protein